MITDQVRSTEEALDLALEALEYASTGNRRPEVIGAALTAIKQARSAPVVPDVMTTAEGEHPEYVQGWNDCRQLMLQIRKHK